MLLGAIDVGTNSIHLIVVEVDPHFGTSRTILKAREMVRLGAGDTLLRGELSEKAIARGVAAIAQFAIAAHDAGASDIRAVATSAVREASNKEDFLAAVQAVSGVTIDVLDDVEEARLIHLGVTRGFPLGGKTACIFDIGGGSTEFIVGDAERPYFLRSVRLGSLRLYEEYLRDETNATAGLRALGKHVRSVLAPVARQVSEYRFETLIGTSGTVLGLAALDAASGGVSSQRTHGYVLQLGRLRALQKVMVSLSAAERRKLPGMNPRRSDIIVAGNAVVIAILESLGRDELVVSERALREGIVADHLERNVAVARTLGDVRARRFDSAHALARRFGQLESHQNNVAGLAVALFDELRDLHGLASAERDSLFAAALVHDVGRAIAASAHHKHGAYIVRAAGLPGWHPDEIEVIAALVRYHRKSAPKATHVEWTSLLAETRAKIAWLAALLRVADGLDRRRLGVVSGVRCVVSRDTVVVRLEASQDCTPEIEAAAFKAELFEKTFSRRIAFEMVQARNFGQAFADTEPGIVAAPA